MNNITNEELLALVTAQSAILEELASYVLQIATRLINLENAMLEAAKLLEKNSK